MVGMKTGPKLVIDHLLTYQLLGMDDFWATLPPPFEDVRTAGKTAYDRAVQIAMGKTCAGCTSLKSAIAPAHDLLWCRVNTLRTVLPEFLPRLIAFIAAKRGYRPRQIEVYYRDEAGTATRLTF